MSKSTPADLAVAFRSLARRRREAIDAAEGAAVADLLGELDHHVSAAAVLVGAPAPDAGAVADVLTARPADDWDDSTLDALRHHATLAGSVLRRVAEAGPGEDDG